MVIEISEVKIIPGRREVQEKHVRELAESISSVGLLNPITVDQTYTLIAGLHRLEAVKLLGWTEIECTVRTLEGLQAEIAEIDENLIRCKLDVVDESEQLARRKEIYETLYPETKRGAKNQYTKGGGLLTDTVAVSKKSFVDDTAETLGVSPRTVSRKIQLAKNLSPDAKDIVKKNGIGVKNALKISRLDASQQVDAASQLASGAIRSMAEYRPSDAGPEELDRSTPEPDAPPDEAQNTALSEEPPPRRFLTFEDNVADLKDPNKDCSCTPDAFLAEISAYIRKFNHGIEWYTSPSYSAVFPGLTSAQVKYLRELMESTHAVLERVIKQIEGSVNT